MKTTILSFLLILVIGQSIAQVKQLPNYDNIKLEQKEDFNEISNSAALSASNYLLSTPLDNKNLDRLNSMLYVIRWMSGTPEYSFDLDEQATKFAKKNDDLLGLYMAAMTKFVLENKSDSKNKDLIKLNAVKLIVNYANDPNNNLKPNKELKKAIEADKNGTLKEYLKL